jgi:hypothetical protein
MKTPQKLLLFLAVLCLSFFFTNCNRLKNNPKPVTEPFVANFTGSYTYAGPDTLPNPKCGEQFAAWRAIVDGNGSEAHLGNFSVHFDFCGDSLSNYGNCYAYMIAADGDSLFLDASGRVLDGRLDDHPAFVTSYWRDTINILGGTGKFSGATGKLLTDDYNSSEDPNSHHNWKGTITLLK